MRSPILGESPGVAAGSAACHISHPPDLPGGDILPSEHSQPQRATVSQNVPGTQSTSQGFPRAWHGHSAVPKPSPEQWPGMASCVMSLCPLSTGQCDLPIPAGVCPSFPAEPFNTQLHVPSHQPCATLPLSPAQGQTLSTPAFPFPSSAPPSSLPPEPRFIWG